MNPIFDSVVSGKVCLQCGRPGFYPWVGNIPWRRKCNACTPGLLPGKSRGQRSLAGYSPWGRKESDTTEWLHFHKLHRLGGLNNMHLFLTILKTGKLKIKILVDPVSGASPPPCSWMAILCQCLHLAKSRGRESKRSWLFPRALIPFLEALPTYLHDLVITHFWISSHLG